jgi:hypothetical protein
VTWLDRNLGYVVGNVFALVFWGGVLSCSEGRYTVADGERWVRRAVVVTRPEAAEVLRCVAEGDELVCTAAGEGCR